MTLPNLARLGSRTLSITESEIASLTNGEKHIFNKLTKELSPLRLRVADVSGGCGSMYAIDIASDQFKGLSVVKQHRKINEILKEEIKEMHGLQLKTASQ
ncbi:unnamed protein product [Umbelopsis vinacea]